MASNQQPTIIKASAAAIVLRKRLKPAIRKSTPDQKFVVHPHIEQVASTHELLQSYLRTIYSKDESLYAELPGSTDYTSLATADSVRDATEAIALSLAGIMSRRRANPGILFGFKLTLASGLDAHGIIKADMEDDRRFHFKGTGGSSWSLESVEELLPSPRSHYAKYVISPRPGLGADTGVRDETAPSSTAADYLLAGLRLSIPVTKGIAASVARAAFKHGHTPDEVDEFFSSIEDTVPLDTAVAEGLPRVPDEQIRRLMGSPTRPATQLAPDDDFIRIYRTREPFMELRVSDAVKVEEIDARTLRVTLPPGSDPIEHDAT